MQAMVSADGSDPREVKQWQRQQAAESDLAAAEEAVKAGLKACTLVLQYCYEAIKCFMLCSPLLMVSADICARLEEEEGRELTQLLSMHEHVQRSNAILRKTVYTSCTSMYLLTIACFKK